MSDDRGDILTDLELLRNRGWSVAVHNDYRLGGERFTFWLLTDGSGRYVKGEGRTDAEALGTCRVQAAWTSAVAPSPAGEDAPGDVAVAPMVSPAPGLLEMLDGDPALKRMFCPEISAEEGALAEAFYGQLGSLLPQMTLPEFAPAMHLGVSGGTLTAAFAERLVERFLSWPLPETVAADRCTTDPSYASPRGGTNLLTAEEARQMIAHLFAPPRPCADSDECGTESVPVR
jgi:hypothetical protein